MVTPLLANQHLTPILAPHFSYLSVMTVKAKTIACADSSFVLALQIQIPSVLPNQLIYAIYLSSSTPAQGQTGWPKIGTSNVVVANPHGLIEIAPSSLNKTVVEGNRVRRQIT